MKIAIQYEPETLALGDQPVFVSATDGDTPTIQVPIRMLGIDAPELHYAGATQKNPGKFDAPFARFLQGPGKALDPGLQAHLAKRLDGAASTRHIDAGRVAFEHFELLREERLARFQARTGRRLVDRRLFTMVARQVFDRNGRVLAYVAPAYTKAERESIPADQRPTFNLLMMQDGQATPLLIYPNVPKADDLALVHKAVLGAKRKRKGVWGSKVPLLQAFEFRWIADTIAGKRDGPDRFCGDFTTGRLYPPQRYYEVPDQNRLWFFKEDTGAAFKLGFELA